MTAWLHRLVVEGWLHALGGLAVMLTAAMNVFVLIRLERVVSAALGAKDRPGAARLEVLCELYTADEHFARDGCSAKEIRELRERRQDPEAGR